MYSVARACKASMKWIMRPFNGEWCESSGGPLFEAFQTGDGRCKALLRSRWTTMKAQIKFPLNLKIFHDCWRSSVCNIHIVYTHSQQSSLCTVGRKWCSEIIHLARQPTAALCSHFIGCYAPPPSIPPTASRYHVKLPSEQLKLHSTPPLLSLTSGDTATVDLSSPIKEEVSHLSAFSSLPTFSSVSVFYFETCHTLRYQIMTCRTALFSNSGFSDNTGDDFGCRVGCIVTCRTWLFLQKEGEIFPAGQV